MGDSMTFIILDLEWNGAYSKRARGYFNEIIEIGAIKMNESMELIDTFHAVIRPVVSRKLSSIVQNLTGIEEEELDEGQPFSRAISQFRKWIADPSAVIMTWSTTDLMVMIENCRYFLKQEQIPFMNKYADLQAYFHSRMGSVSSQQTGLSKACEMLKISDDELDMHRALDDSILTGKVFACIYDNQSFQQFVYNTDDEFYKRLTFKTTIISDLENEHVKISKLKFKCSICDRPIKRISEWNFRNRAFYSDFRCKHCNKKYTARVQVKLKYDGAETNKKLTPKPEPTRENDNNSEEAN
jgi:inhibitor of KinA sporulation pathway (predicted exonuclease)